MRFIRLLCFCFIAYCIGLSMPYAQCSTVNFTAPSSACVNEKINLVKLMSDLSREVLFIPATEMQSEFCRILIDLGFEKDKANSCAKIFTENSLDGVYTHGVNRFPRFVQYIKKGFIKIDAEPTIVNSFGGLEQWNGNSGPGPLNAVSCTDRAMALAQQFGIGSVCLAQTNHWMRGGTYGWRAAAKGFIFISWTNTIANMPPWGSAIPKLGNNPLVFAVPYGKEAIVLDMAMSQFSFGAMELQKLKGKKLSVMGGFDSKGELTMDPGEILESKRALPIGYWKGAGLSLLLDVLATVLSGGLSVHQISQQDSEINVSQVFIAIDMTRLHNFSTIDQIVKNIIADYHASSDGIEQVVFPGERVMALRKENKKNGIPVLGNIWGEIKGLNS